MGACVVVKSKKQQTNRIRNANEPLNDLETREFAEFHDKKTVRAYDK